MKKLGPNHGDGCDGKTWQHSGDGYNRVKVCVCGAEDHDPAPKSLGSLVDAAVKMAREWDGREPWDEQIKREQGR